MLPTLSPITAKNFNYTSVAIAVVLGFSAVWWFASARRWFTGPRIHDLQESTPYATTDSTPAEENG